METFTQFTSYYVLGWSTDIFKEEPPQRCWFLDSWLLTHRGRLSERSPWSPGIIRLRKYSQKSDPNNSVVWYCNVETNLEVTTQVIVQCSHNLPLWQHGNRNQDHTLTTPTSFSTVYPHLIHHFNISKKLLKCSKVQFIQDTAMVYQN